MGNVLSSAYESGNFGSEFVACALYTGVGNGSAACLSKLLATINAPKPIAITCAILYRILVVTQTIKLHPKGIPNPTHRLGATVAGLLGPVEGMSSVLGCIFGNIFGTEVLHRVYNMLGMEKEASAMVPPKPAAKLSKPMIALVESTVAFIYVYSLVVLLKMRGQVGPGLLGIIGAIVFGSKLTGPGIDPGAVIARSILFRDYKYLSLYLSGSTLGAVLAGIYIKPMVPKVATV